MNAANATTSLRATLNQILSPSVQSEQALAKVGLTFEQLRDALSSGKLDLLGVLELLKKAFDGNTAAISEAFPNLRALRAVLGLVGSNMEDNRMIMDAMADSTGVANEAYEAQVGTLQFELNQMLSAYKTMNIAVGDTLAKYVIPILDRMTAMFERQAVSIPLAIDKFAMYFNLLRGDDSVEEFNKKMVEAFGVSNVAFKKDYAPMLIELRDQSRRVFDNVKLAINLLVESFKKNFGDLIPVVDTTGFTIENFANLIILVINKVSSYLAFTGFPKIRKFMDNAKEQFERFKPILDAVREKFKVIFDAVLEIVEIFRSQYNKINENFGGEIRKFVTDVKDFFVSRFQALIDTVLGIVKIFTALFSGDFSLFKEGLIQLLTGLFNWFYASFKFFFDKARLIIQAGLLIVKNLFKFAFRGVIELLDFLIMGVVNGIVKLGQLMKQGFNVALDFVKKLWSDFKEWISNYWTGVLIPFIKDQVAKFNEFVGKIGRFILETLPEMIGNGVRKIFDWFRDWFGSGGKLRAVIEGFMDNMMSRIEKGLAKAVEFFKTGFTKIKDFISGFAGKIANTVGGIFDRIKQTIIDKITNMIGSLNKVIDRYNKLVPSALRVDKIPTPNFDGAALGGTISSAGSVLVGETGPELLNLPTGASITPLPTSSMSGIDPALQRALGKTVNVTIELDSEVIANKTAPIMVDEIRLRQGIGIV